VFFSALLNLSSQKAVASFRKFAFFENWQIYESLQAAF